MKFQCATLQIDFQLPARFELYYSAEGEEGKKEAPVMIHIAIFGSVERSLAITVANPTDLVKVRLRAEKKLPPGAPRRYSGTLNASSTILRQEGVGVLWTGIGPNIACNAMINAAELARYDQVKQTLLKILGLKAMLSLIFLLVWGVCFGRSVWIKDGQIWYLSLDNNVGYRFQTKQMY
ncbi:mitochondrial uncoupling protein 1-like isoform X3 [Rosa rugosa]|uniref:mitochondrial uncoupling protein 1-like isoform X3 n=1 Tax=Rosa rugosa TaxID=74645 RepID=UPI002B407015|nr:mitochondrial uncoupling protein 1-like isoform X3 [Rosa rugosa]